MPNFTLEQAHSLLRETIETNLRHIGYTRTIELRDDYRVIMTGKGFERFIPRFTLRCDTKEFQQQLELTHENLSSTSSLLQKKFSQIFRVQDIKRGLNFEGTSQRDQQDLQDVLSDFGGEGSSQRGTLEDYLARIYERKAIIDPNLFVLYDFSPFDANLGERARPYGIQFDCDNVLNFRYTRGHLDYLLVRIYIAYKDLEGIKKSTFDYLCFIGPQTIRYYHVAEGRKDLPETTEVWEDPASKQYYRMVEFSPGIPYVPAVRLGYVPDPENDGLTMVSPAFHPAMSLFKELIDLKSTNDIVTKKHGYPREISQSPPCPGEKNEQTGYSDPCVNGTNLSTGQRCKACGGSGHLLHKSEQDTLVMDLPNDPEDWADLSKLVYTVKPELDTIKSFDEKIENKKIEIVKTIFSVDQQVKVESPAKTATEYVVSREDQNNTLLPHADYFSFGVKTSTIYVALLMNISGKVEPLHEYARDLKLTTADEIREKIISSYGKVSDLLLEQMYDDYYQKVYESDPIALKWYYFQKQHINFFLTPSEQFTMYAASEWIDPEVRSRKVFGDAIKADLMATVPNILDLSYQEQETKIAELVKGYMAKLPKTVNMSEGIRIGQQQQEEQTT